MFQQFLSKEKAYFNKLHQDARKLITANFLYGLISPVFGIFLNAFLCRQSHNILFVATFNSLMFAVIPVGFYLNGFLLRRFSPAITYTFCIIIAGLAAGVLIFLPSISFLTVVIFSIVYGISAGIFWATRNLLTLKTTTTHDRMYYSSLESALNTTTGVLLPVIIGWFITLGSFVHLYTPRQGYQLLIIYMVIVILRISGISKTINTPDITVPTLLVKNSSNKWKKFRLIEFFMGLSDAILTFVPVLLVLILVGNEGTLGTVQSISAIIASVLIYSLGKSVTTSHRVKLIAISVICTITGALFYSSLYSAIGVFILFASQAIAQQFMWVGSNSINYDLIDMDNKDPQQHYAY